MNVAKPLIPQLVSKGEVIRGYLGVGIQTLTPELAKALKMDKGKGALVVEVCPESPAANAGIQQGDVIVAFNKEPIEGSRELSSLVAQTPVGQEVPVVVLRDEAEKKLSVKIAKLQSERNKPEESGQPAQGKWGLGLRDLNPQVRGESGRENERGVLVGEVQPGSPADLAGVRVGDIILSANRHPVNSAKEAIEEISKGSDKEALLLLLKREQGSFFVALAK